MLTPYQFASNRPIDGVDLDGLEWFSVKSLVDLYNWGKNQVELYFGGIGERFDKGIESASQGMRGDNDTFNQAPISQESKDFLHKVQANAGFAEAMTAALEPTRDAMSLLHSGGAVVNSIADAATAADNGDLVSMSTSLVFIPLDVLTLGKGSKAFKVSGKGITGEVGRTANEIGGQFKARGSDHTVEFLGELDITDGVMTVSEIAVFPIGAEGNEAKNKVGQGSMVRMLRILEGFAKKEGASKLRITGTRVENSSSANPGHAVDIIRDIK